jgi:hypothetical protein
MKPFRPIIASSLAALLVIAALAPTAAQTRREVVPGPALGGSSNCWAVGESVAASRGGELMNASPVVSGGRQACVVIIVVRDAGQRPRRIEMVVPLN